jgi:hypothetical protein
MSLLDRLKSFLPEIERANAEIVVKIKEQGQEAVQIDAGLMDANEADETVHSSDTGKIENESENEEEEDEETKIQKTKPMVALEFALGDFDEAGKFLEGDNFDEDDKEDSEDLNENQDGKVGREIVITETNTEAMIAVSSSRRKHKPEPEELKNVKG